MRMEQVWSMPNKATFQIPPVRKLLKRYVGDGKGWIDPFSGGSSFAEITNDINEKLKATSHVDALEFLKGFDKRSVKGVLFDAPYSYEKAIRLYGVKYEDTQSFFNHIMDCKKEVCRIVDDDGLVIIFGWTSNGLGTVNGFDMIELLLITHGWQTNDTIVTVECRTEYIDRFSSRGKDLSEVFS